jgi:hypothetical protein
MTGRTKPTIFTISAEWDSEASIWTGHCDDIPAAADMATLNEFRARITAMAFCPTIISGSIRRHSSFTSRR